MPWFATQLLRFDLRPWNWTLDLNYWRCRSREWRFITKSLITSSNRLTAHETTRQPRKWNVIDIHRCGGTRSYDEEVLHFFARFCIASVTWITQSMNNLGRRRKFVACIMWDTPASFDPSLVKGNPEFSRRNNGSTRYAMPLITLCRRSGQLIFFARCLLPVCYKRPSANTSVASMPRHQ